MIKKILSGFSLMEMMVVLLIVAVVLAASAPMISKKMVANIQTGSGSSLWQKVFSTEHIYYNGTNDDNHQVLIGTQATDSSNPRLIVKSKDNKPQIRLENNTTNVESTYLTFTDDGSVAVSGQIPNNKRSVAIGHWARTTGIDGVAIGHNVYAAEKAVAIGTDYLTATKASGNYSVAIGPKVTSSAYIATAIGAGAEATQEGAAAYGSGAKATYKYSTALGSYANTNSAEDSVAIGSYAKTYASNSISIGHLASDESNNAYRAISIGTKAQATNDRAIAIGSGYYDTTNKKWVSTTSASGSGSIAIGTGATASQPNSVAIGRDAVANTRNTIVLGTKHDLVYIPGMLMTGRDVILNADTVYSRTYIRTDANKFGLGCAGYLAALTRDGNASDGKPGASWHNDWPKYPNWQGGTDGMYFQTYDTTNPSKIRFCPYYSQQGNSAYIFEKNLSLPVPQNWNPSSDRRLKNVGDVYKGGLAELKKLEFYHYTFKKDENKTPRVGVMAQDLQKVFPDAVIKGEDGFLRIRLEDMFYAVINAVKELDTRLTAISEQVKSNVDLISKLQDKVTAQDSEIKELKKQNSEFEKRLEKLEKACKKDK